MLKFMLPVALIAGFTLPAAAAEYYVVRGPDKNARSLRRGRPRKPSWWWATRHS